VRRAGISDFFEKFEFEFEFLLIDRKLVPLLVVVVVVCMYVCMYEVRQLEASAGESSRGRRPED
jgi:hypothetical protein